MQTLNTPLRMATVLWLFLLPAVFMGCGRKDAPMVPGQPAVAAVADLTARIRDNAVQLTWHQSGKPDDVKGYVIYRAEAALDNETCAGCPQVFRKIERIERCENGGACTFTDPAALRPGFRYTYKLQTVLTGNAAGPRSNSVSIDTQKHGGEASVPTNEPE